MPNDEWKKEDGVMGMPEDKGTLSGGVEEMAPELPMEGLPLGGRTPYREHTAVRWKRDDPHGYSECCALIRLGLTNQSELARIFHPKSRQSIDALMMSDEFATGEIEGIIKKRALIGTAQLQDKLMELADKAKSTKDIGGIAIGLTTMHNIKQISQGGPTEIKEHRHRFSIEDFEAARAKRKANTDSGKVVEMTNDECRITNDGGVKTLAEVAAVPVELIKVMVQSE